MDRYHRMDDDERNYNYPRDYERYERDYFDRAYDIRTGRRVERYDEYPEAYREEPKKKKKGFLESFRGARESEEYAQYAESQQASNVVICYPKTYSDIQILIDSLKHRQPIIADLAKIKDDSAQRILDFMSGAVYALSGSMHRITASIFLLTPEGMSIKVPMDLKQKLEKR